MKILYAIQGTGNGHMSRAVEVGPILEKFGNVDYMVSGAQVEIGLNKEVKYKSQGFGFYFGKRGGVDITKTFKRNSSRRVYREIKDFPIEQYDLIVNDFEPISAWAAKFKKKKCVALSHQSALLSKKCPEPRYTDPIGKVIIHKYAPASKHYGFHFSAFDKNIFTPIVKQSIRNANTKNFGHYTVYLPAYADETLIGLLHNIRDVKWEVFSKHTKVAYDRHNVSIRPVGANSFNESMITCEGVLCGAGFETPSEALYLGKKLMVIPMKNQYEQTCNAVALEQMGVPVLTKLNSCAVMVIKKWVEHKQALQVAYPDQTENIIQMLIADCKDD